MLVLKHASKRHSVDALVSYSVLVMTLIVDEEEVSQYTLSRVEGVLGHMRMHVGEGYEEAVVVVLFLWVGSY